MSTSDEQKLIDAEARKLQKDYSKNGMRGETLRNRIGNVYWPTMEKTLGVLKWAAVGMVAASAVGAAPFSAGLVVSAACVAGAQNWAKGHIKYLQNLTLKNAALFGRKMQQQNVPQNVAQRAMEFFLQKESPLFTSGSYIKKNPEAVTDLSQGKPVEKNRNFVSFFEANVNALASKKSPTLKDRWQAYKRSFEQWQEARKSPKTANNADNQGESLQQATARIASSGDVLKKSLSDVRMAGPATIDRAKTVEPVVAQKSENDAVNNAIRNSVVSGR